MSVVRRLLLALAVLFAVVLAFVAFLGRLPGRRGPTLVDVASEFGLDLTTKSWSATPADLDGDGWLDLVLVRHDSTTEDPIYRNEGGRFEEVFAFPRRDRHDCTAADANGDGASDVYCTIGAKRGAGTGENELWIQDPDRPFAFRDQAADWGVTDPTGRGRRAIFPDVNRDGSPDLFVTNEFPRQDDEPSTNRLFLNEQGRTFRPAPEYGLDLELDGRCVEAADYDDDGWVDVLQCTQHGLRLFRNDGGTRFADVSEQVRLGARDVRDATLADVDGDGDLDLAVMTFGALIVRPQDGGRFRRPERVLELDLGFRVAAGDVDGDRDPDLYALQRGRPCEPDDPGGMPDHLLVNDGSANFAAMTVPNSDRGCGDDVEAFDADRDGRDEFLVLNGRLVEGPVELFDLR